jgi:hypothetical protein
LQFGLLKALLHGGLKGMNTCSIIYNLKEDKYYLHVDGECAGSVDDRQIAIEIFEKMVTRSPLIFKYASIIVKPTEL